MGGMKSSGTVRVLYIDDSGVEREIVRGLLEAEGFEVMSTGNVDAGTSLAASCPPDLVLLDLHMPDRPGSMVVEELRKVPGMEKVPVVALSASIREEERAEVLARFDGFVKKPVDPATFPLLVRELIAAGRLEEEPAREREEEGMSGGVKGFACKSSDPEEALKTLEEVRAVMSHDLRTPLTVIISYAGTVSKEKAGPLNDQQRAMLETVVEHGFKMDALISDLVRKARETLDRYEGNKEAQERKPSAPLDS
jgi:two-component system cell cycle response regulator DivK